MDVISLPLLLDWTVIAGWIFGGCCSNVYALEAIIKEEPDSGMLITFAQFLLVALVTLPSHLQYSDAATSVRLKPRAVPLYRWIPNIVMFFAVNLLNNHAFGYNISVPVHIILRSGGSVLTMLVGWVWGKKYSRIQVLSVIMLTLGIIMAAMSDAQSKQKEISSASLISTDPNFLAGLAILFIAQLLSAIMGLYVQLTYAAYGSHWEENLFYSHALSLPLFLPFLPGLTAQYHTLLRTSKPVSLSSSFFPTFGAFTAPNNILLLALNATTQAACIRGVNLLAARTTAVGVSIALNLRKLASLALSIVIFGNVLPGGVIAGAAVVFASAAVWAWEEQRLKQQKKMESAGRAGESNGSVKREKVQVALTPCIHDD